jgi:hypothetical protein
MPTSLCVVWTTIASEGRLLFYHYLWLPKLAKGHIFGVFLGAALALVGPLAGEGRGDFVLQGDEQLTVTESHDSGTLAPKQAYCPEREVVHGA